MDREQLRQVFHLILGFIGIAVIYLLGRNWLMAGAFFSLLIGTLIINQLMIGRSMRPVRRVVGMLERDDVLFPGWGMAAFAAGVLLIATALESVPEIAAALFVLGVGDGFSTLIGRKGKHKLPHNKKKTWEGVIAFFISSLPAYYFVGPVIVPVALVAAAVESIDSPLDDNVTIPIACSFMFLIL